MAVVDVTSRIEMQFVAGTWTALATRDVLGDIVMKRGIPGSGPTDVVAGRGELTFDLDNSTKNAGGVLGWYSPAHASKRSGWTYGVAIRWILYYEAAASVTSITRSGVTATVTQTAHGFATGDYVLIAGAVETDYNGVFSIAVTGVDEYTYVVANAPSTPATGTITATHVYVRFRGKVAAILPEPGSSLSRRVSVTCYDAMDDLLTADLTDVTVQTAQTESQLLATLVAALPTAAQPPAMSFATGIDTFAYCFDKLGDGIKAASAAKDVVLSTLGALYVRGDGTLVYRTRRDRAAMASSFTLTNTMVELVVPSSLDNVFNRVATTCHPKTVDAAATTVLWAQTGAAPSIPAGATVTIIGTYRDPNDTQTLIGGLAQVTPIVATTDYTGNDAADGGGTDRTGSVSVVTTAYATRVEFAVTNGFTGPIYLTKLQLRGKGVYDIGPRTFEAATTIAAYDRPVEIDMPYQEDVAIAQSVGLFVNAQYQALAQQADAVGFVAGRSTTFMAAAMALEPTAVVTVTESVTGLAAVPLTVQGIELHYAHKRSLRARLLTAPAAPYQMWALGTAGFSELGSTTILGF